MRDERFQKTTRLKMPAQQAASRPEPAPQASQNHSRLETSLDALAAPVLELILQVRAGQITPSMDLRPRVDGMLKHLEERGRALRYNDGQINAVKFAMASFVDETVLTADFHLRDLWEKNPLQLEYFGEHLAGVKFFDRLEEMLRKPEENGETIEIYYLCLLLGFKGRYNIYFEEQLKDVIRNTAAELRRIGRLVDMELSPHWRAVDQPAPPRDPGLPLWAKIGSGVGAGLVILIYMVLYFLLRTDVNAAKEQLLR